MVIFLFSLVPFFRKASLLFCFSSANRLCCSTCSSVNCPFSSISSSAKCLFWSRYSSTTPRSSLAAGSVCLATPSFSSRNVSASRSAAASSGKRSLVKGLSFVISPSFEDPSKVASGTPPALQVQSSHARNGVNVRQIADRMVGQFHSLPKLEECWIGICRGY